MLVFILAFAILLISSLPWMAILKPPNKTAGLLALYLVSSANVVLVCLVANSFLILNQKWIVLSFHVLLGIIGWGIWSRMGKPYLRDFFSNWKLDIPWFRRDPLLATMSLAVFICYSFAFIQIMLIPQNNVDSLSTHLTRIGFWFQRGSFFPWPTHSLDQLWYPINAQLQTYWTLLFLGSDRLVGAAQWLAAVVSGLGIFGLANLFGYTSRQSAFAGLIFLTFPMVALQSTTTQTDLITTVFFIPAVYFLILGISTNQASLLVLSAISIGLGIGVKKSYFLLLPVLAVIVFLIVMQYGRRSFRSLIIWVFSVALGILLLGAYMYVVNWHYWGSPFGSPTYIDSVLGTSPSENTPIKASLRLVNSSTHISEKGIYQTDKNIFLELVYNIPRLLYQALDTSGLPDPWDGYLHKVKLRVVRAVFQFIGFDEIEGAAFTAPGHIFSFSDKNINEESHAWYGPLSILLIFPAIFIKSRQALHEKFFLLLIPSLAILVFLPLEVVFRPGWDPFQGRYFAPVVALCAPFMATWFKEKTNNSIYEWLIGILAIVIVVVTLLYNPSKPTLGKFADEFHVWNNDRIFIQTIQRKNERRVYTLLDKHLPTRTTLGYYIPFYFMEYPLFGEQMQHTLVPIALQSQVSDAQWLHSQGIEYLLLPSDEGYPIPPAEYQKIAHIAKWDLFASTSVP